MASEHAKKLRGVAAQLSTERFQGWSNPLVGVITDAADFIDGTVTADTGDAVLSRPAPAATDTGLEAYAHDNGTLSGLSRNEHGPWCLRSLAEELLAAERAEKERLAALLHDNGTPRFNAVCERAEKAEAIIAAKDARIEFLERVAADQETQIVKQSTLEADNAAKDQLISDQAEQLQSASLVIDDLQTKLAVAEQQLQGIVTAWESLPGGRNYSTGEVQDWLLGPMQKAINRIRAVLGGKPS